MAAVLTIYDCQALEDQIRTGQIAKARASLEKIGSGQVPRDLAAKLAELCRRAGLFTQSIRTLGKIVRPERALDKPATPRELAEYGFALVKIGAVEEGKEILSQVDTAKEPIAAYYLALSLFPDWNYGLAVPRLEKYVADSDPDAYYTLVAQVNLASAYLQVGDTKKAAALLEEGLKTSERNGHRLLNANFLELSAQLSLKNEKFDRAIDLLQQSSTILSASGLFDELFVRKWLCLVEAYRAPGSASTIAALHQMRTQAAELGHWETLRDLDYHAAYIQQDAALFHHLFHGTPQKAYREHLKNVFTQLPAPPTEYDWVLKAGDGAPCLDVQQATLDGALTGLKTGQLLHKLLVELTGDFYRPARIPTLATKLFEGQYYDPNTTPNRLHQIVVRLRRWLESAEIGLEVEEIGGSYRLKAANPLILKVSSGEAAALPKIDTTSRKKLLALQQSIGAKEFSIKDVSDSLECSPSTALRVVNAGLNGGLLDRTNQEKPPLYRFKPAA